MWHNAYSAKGVLNLKTYEAPKNNVVNKNWYVGLTKTDKQRMQRHATVCKQLEIIAKENAAKYVADNNIVKCHTPLKLFVETFEIERMKEMLNTCKVPKDLDEVDENCNDIYIFKDSDGKARLVIQPRTLFVRETYLNTLPKLFEECVISDVPGWVFPLPDESEFIRGIELKLK